jgi:hypothetical protein
MAPNTAIFHEVPPTVTREELNCQYWRANYHFFSVTDTGQGLNYQPMATWTGLDCQLMVIRVFNADPPSLILSLQIVLKPESTQTYGVFSPPAGAVRSLLMVFFGSLHRHP